MLKSKIIFIFTLLLILTTTSYSANKKPIQLTQEEKEYLEDNPIVTMCNNPNWKPIEFRQDYKIKGIVIDVLTELEKDLNIKFRSIQTTSWSQSQLFLKDKRCDILPAAIKTSKRAKYSKFTKPYLNYKLAVITKNDKPLINSLDDIIDKTISRKKGSGLIQKLKTRCPKMKIIETKDYLEALKKVSNGEVYCTIATLPVASYFINEFAINNLYVAGYIDMTYNLSIAVRDDKEILKSILDKALLNISQEQHQLIHNKWSNLTSKKTFDYKPLINISFIILVIIIFLLYKQYLLKNSIKDYQELLDSTIEALLLVKDEKIIEVNQSAIDIFKVKSKDQLLNTSIFDHIPEESIKTVKHKMDTNFTDNYEINLIKHDGTIFNALVKGCPLKNKKLRLTSIIDITKSKEQERLLLEQAKLASMGEMIGNIAHQWRQPLSIINTASSSMKLQKDINILDDEFFYKSCKSITTNAKFLSHTIDDFRDFINNDRIKKEFKIKDMIESFLTLNDSVITSNQIHIVLDIKDHLVINSYKNELIQCILNIFNNSVDALNQNNIEDKYIFIKIKEHLGSVKIQIKDNALGISNNIINKIFEPYFTTKHKSQGTGLGLHMTYKLIKDGLEGNIEVKNISYTYQKKTFTGAIFTIILKKN